MQKPSEDKKPLVATVSKIGGALIGLGRYDDALLELLSALEQARSLGDSILAAPCLSNLGVIYDRKNNYELAEYYYGRALSLYRVAGDSVKVATARLNLGIALKEQGRYPEALGQLLMSAPIFEQKGLKRQLASCYSTVGNVQRLVGSHQKALNYLFRSLEIRRDLDNKDEQAASLNNIGMVYNSIGRYDSALSCYTKALSIKKGLRDQRAIANTLDNIGESYMLMRAFSNALDFYNQALEIRRAISDRKGIATTLQEIAEVELLSGDLLHTAARLNEARHLADSSGANEVLIENYMLSAKLAERLRQFEEALNFERLHHALKDSLMNIERQVEAANIEARYDTEKKETSIRILSLQDREKQAQLKVKDNYIFLLITGLLLLVTFGAYAYHIKRRDDKRKKKSMQELHHRVKNHLQQMGAMLELQMDRSEEGTRLILGQVKQRIDAMLLVHQRLSRSEPGHVMIDEYMRELLRGIYAVFGKSEREIKLVAELQPLRMSADEALISGLIVNELVSNAFKYAFADREAGMLSVSLKAEQGNISICVQDDGPGYNKTEQEQGFGLQFVRMLAMQWKGDLQITNVQGAKFTVCFYLSSF